MAAGGAGNIATWHVAGRQKAYIDQTGTYWSGSPDLGQETTRLLGWRNGVSQAWIELAHPGNNVSLKDLSIERWRSEPSGNFIIPGTLSFNSNYGSSAPAYGCRAWVNFNSNTGGASVITIRASGNVSSITDGGVGDFTINFATPMPDTNYAVAATSDHAAGITRSTAFTTESYTTTGVLLQAGYGSSFFDPVYCNVVVIR
jgi:hypothetical protein